MKNYRFTGRRALGYCAWVASLAGTATFVWHLAPTRPIAVSASKGSGFQAIAALARQTTTIDGLPSRGDVSASVVVVEFSDYQCPFCARLARDVEPEFFKRYVDKGRVLWVFRQLPLTTIHPLAQLAGQAAVCADRQGRFPSMHEALFANRLVLSEKRISELAITGGLVAAQFQECLSGYGRERVLADVAEASRLRLEGTPTLLVGSPESGTNIRIAKGLYGAGALDELVAVVESLLTSRSELQK